MSLKSAFEGIKRAFGEYPNQALIVPIDISKCNPSEKLRMTDIVNRLAKSEMGKHTLEAAAKAGYQFSFERMFDASGYANLDNKVIVLNSVNSDNSLITTLCHECRHAEQMDRYTNKGIRDDELDIPSNILLFRAMEADAQACAFFAAQELSRCGDSAPKMSFSFSAPKISNAGKKALKQTGGQLNHEVLTKAFQAWYDQKNIKGIYEEAYIVSPMEKTLRNLKANIPETLNCKIIKKKKM